MFPTDKLQPESSKRRKKQISFWSILAWQWEACGELGGTCFTKEYETIWLKSGIREAGGHTYLYIYMAVCTSYFMYFYVRLSRVYSVPIHLIYIRCVLLSCWECYQPRLSFNLLEILQILLSAFSIGFQLIVDLPLNADKRSFSLEILVIVWTSFSRFQIWESIMLFY